MTDVNPQNNVTAPALSVEQIVFSLERQRDDLAKTIRGNNAEIDRLQQANKVARGKLSTTKRLLTAAKPRDRKAPTKKAAKTGG